MKIISICFTTSPQNVFTEGFFNVCYGLENFSLFNQIVISSKVTESEINLYEFKNKKLFFFKKNKIFKSLYTIFKILKTINKEKPNYIFFYGENPFHTLISLLIYKKCRIYTHIVDPVPHSDSNGIKKYLFNLSRLVLIIRSYKILLASNNIQKDYIRYYKRFLPIRYLKRKSGIMKLANLEYLEKTTSIAKIKCEKEFTFIFFGRITKYKGVELLIKAFEIFSKNTDYKLLICGRGELTYQTKSPQVILKNEYLSYNELLKLIAKSEAVILPYLDATGTHTLQIANRLGIPVLASNVGCFVDYIEQGVNGLIFNSNNIDSLLETMSYFMSNKFEFKKSEIQKYNELNFSNETITKQIIKEFEK